VARDPKTDLLTINGEIVVSLVLARCQPQGDGRLRWRIRFDPMRYQADVTLAVRLDPENRDELDYYLLPWLDLPRQEIRLCNRTSIAFEAFRFEDLGFFYGMAERVGIRRKWG
jgi:hypothetical protein